MNTYGAKNRKSVSLSIRNWQKRQKTVILIILGQLGDWLYSHPEAAGKDSVDFLTKKIPGITIGKRRCDHATLRFFSEPGMWVLSLPSGGRSGDLQLPVLLLPAIRSGRPLRGKLHLHASRHQKLYELPAPAPQRKLRGDSGAASSGNGDGKA